MNDPYSNCIAVTSRSIARRDDIEQFLRARVDYVSGRSTKSSAYAAVAGWGLKRSGRAARELAARWGVPALSLEDGFLRSAGDGTDPHCLSMSIDDLGIYYDARQPSRLEQLIAADVSRERHARVHALTEAWRVHRLSKYNHARDAKPPLETGYVLVVDQTAHDESISGALCSSTDFARMLEAALDEHPGAKVLLKVHPDVFAGRKKGHFDALTRSMAERVVVVGRHYHAPDLIEGARIVYVVSSQVGFEALVWNRPVRAFGMPFYAGWGLTHDELPRPERRCNRSLEALVHAALIAYPKYLDPETGLECEVEEAVRHISLQRSMRARFPETIHAIGFSRWKRPIARAFFSGSELRFLRSERALPGGAAAVAVWGSTSLKGAKPGRRVIRVEDGFVRSVGLGARLVAPLSWVQDDEGIYYDPSESSRLETLIENRYFDETMLERAARLRQIIVRERVTKYNLNGSAWSRPSGVSRVILVAGQVEGDASLRFGGHRIKTNRQLIEAVREAEPDAYIAYKPHPDVVAGLREGAVPPDVVRRYCNEVLTSESISDLLPKVDEVHVTTSLTGFEALLMGKRVVTYGTPFYAGWGLTVDRGLSRQRRPGISLDALVAATLIAYPTYVSASSGRFTTPERAVHELARMRNGDHVFKFGFARANRIPEVLLRAHARARRWFMRPA
ncbi:capsular polysaccharide biosynthesis protein [Caballeronia sp. INDeC2]|uniref:capsular polysaccharide biosynthesis protein n=1 Tax=Caballeronia sp. INDeC2 TaxID=2921747 RepID=UPI0020282B0E|nr:capsular polysaccharide biosynthesis protein [Caballeronia sp. INDeC2]